MMNPTMYYQTKIMSNLFLDQPDSKGITFRMATQMDHFWDVSSSNMNSNISGNCNQFFEFVIKKVC